MSAYAMVFHSFGNFIGDKLIRTNLRDTTKNDFSHLPVSGDGTLVLKGDQALYLYGEKNDLKRALTNLRRLKVKSENDNPLVLYRARLVSRKTLKKKQILMLTEQSGYPPIQLREKEVSTGGTTGRLSLVDKDKLIRLINQK